MVHGASTVQMAGKSETSGGTLPLLVRPPASSVGGGHHLVCLLRVVGVGVGQRWLGVRSRRLRVVMGRGRRRRWRENGLLVAGGERELLAVTWSWGVAVGVVGGGVRVGVRGGRFVLV